MGSLLSEGVEYIFCLYVRQLHYVRQRHFKNCIWHGKKWEGVAWQPTVGMQRTSVVFLYQHSISFFWSMLPPPLYAGLVGLSVIVLCSSLLGERGDGVQSQLGHVEVPSLEEYLTERQEDGKLSWFILTHCPEETICFCHLQIQNCPDSWLSWYLTVEIIFLKKH